MSRRADPEIWNFPEASECTEGALTILSLSLLAMQSPAAKPRSASSREGPTVPLSLSALTSTLVQSSGL